MEIASHSTRPVLVTLLWTRAHGSSNIVNLTAVTLLLFLENQPPRLRFSKVSASRITGFAGKPGVNSLVISSLPYVRKRNKDDIVYQKVAAVQFTG